MAYVTSNSYGAYVQPGSVENHVLPSGHAGSIFTAHRIRDLIKQGTKNFKLRQFTMRILANVPEKDKIAEIYAIHEWVRNNLIYREDPVGIDLVIGAPEILEMLEKGISGFDCDDMVVFESTLLRIAGIPVDLAIIKGNPRAPHLWSHIYLIAYDVRGGKAIPLDPIMKGNSYPMGWEAPRYYQKKIIPLDGLNGTFNGYGLVEPSVVGKPQWEFKRIYSNYLRNCSSFPLTAVGADEQALWNSFIPFSPIHPGHLIVD